MSGDPVIEHATCVAYQARGLLIRGASGRGKSALALSLMAFGADLVSDDRVKLTLKDGLVVADAAPNIRGMIEARGIGLLAAESVGPVPVVAVVDLDQAETDRLPVAHQTRVMGQSVPLFRAVDAPHFAPALIQYLKSGPAKVKE